VINVQKSLCPGFSLLTVFLALASARPANAALVTITQTRDFDINLGTESLTWAQFDSGLGTLTSVLYSVAGELTGSFVVANLSPNAMTVRNSTNIFDIEFTGPGSPDTFPGSVLAPITTNPPTGPVGTIVPGATVQVFTIVGNPPLVVPELQLISFASYFTGVGTINSTISQTPEVSVTGDNFAVSMGNVRSVGTATLIYVYDTTVIPEPFTVVFTGGVIGIGAVAGWRRRRRAACIRSESAHTVTV